MPQGRVHRHRGGWSETVAVRVAQDFVPFGCLLGDLYVFCACLMLVTTPTESAQTEGFSAGGSLTGVREVAAAFRPPV